MIAYLGCQGNTFETMLAHMGCQGDMLETMMARIDRRSLRSASTDQLVMPSFKLSTIGSRTFKVAAAQTWNGLPDNVNIFTNVAYF